MLDEIYCEFSIKNKAMGHSVSNLWNLEFIFVPWSKDSSMPWA